MSAHYLQPLQKTTLPSRHIIFDTETQLSRRAGALEHRYATGAYTYMVPGELNSGIYSEANTPEELWAAIVNFCRKGHRTVAWAHNLSFDLRVSEALRWLPRQDFKLEGIVLERTASWASWSSEKYGSLLCCDLYAWLPRTLDDIAREMGVSRETWSGERYEQATLPELQTRCIQDVQITRQAIQILMQWLQDEDCGPFRLTGSGQAHACWRKRFEAGKQGSEPRRLAAGVWVHGDPALRSLEREAMWTGRCEAWKHGKQTGPLYEYDMNLAYCRIAANHELPVKLAGEHGALTPQQIGQIVEDGRAVLAEVTVRTEIPCVPARVGERIIWPIGTFNTILWNPELDLLTWDTNVFHVKRCWSYHTGPALKPMAEWIIEGLSHADTPAPVRLLLKHWARALIGRMALRYRRWEDYGTMPDLGLALWVGYDEEGLPVENLQVGRDRFWLAELTETETSVPQITGWVMSQCRAQLWRAIQSIGQQNVLYMDTDSLLLKGIGSYRYLEHNLSRVDNFEHKATWSHAMIYGPRNLELDTERRLSGIPRTATRKGPLEYEGTVMRGIKESIIRDELDHVAQLPRPYHISDADPRRERYPDGSTLPYRLGGEDV